MREEGNKPRRVKNTLRLQPLLVAVIRDTTVGAEAKPESLTGFELHFLPLNFELYLNL